MRFYDAGKRIKAFIIAVTAWKVRDKIPVNNA